MTEPYLPVLQDLGFYSHAFSASADGAGGLKRAGLVCLEDARRCLLDS